MFQASERVTRNEWREFATSMGLMERYPGVRGLGVVVPVAPERLEEFLVLGALRRRSEPAAEILSRGGDVPRAQGDEHFIVLYLEPEERNAAVIGIDLSSEPARRAAAIRARDTGQPAITTQIPVFQDPPGRPGFLYFLPVYKGIEPATTVEERRARFRGWIFAPFMTADFFRSALGDLSDQIHAEIFAGDFQRRRPVPALDRGRWGLSRRRRGLAKDHHPVAGRPAVHAALAYRAALRDGEPARTRC